MTAEQPAFSDLVDRNGLIAPEVAPPRLTETLETSEPLRDIAGNSEASAALLTHAVEGSGFLAGIICRDPEMVAGLLAAPPAAEFARILDDADRLVDDATSFAEAEAALRTSRTRAAALIALADIAGIWSVDRVIEALSETAVRLISAAVRHLLAAAHANGKLIAADPARPDLGSGYIVLAMGKLGAGELNFSSDIDLIVLFDDEISPFADPYDARPFFVRMTKDLVRLLHEHTGDGYVYRTDLRLRPDPGATNVAISVAAATQYYESLGQNWERAAMIKARPIAGDIEAGANFLTELRPFIWRKYLDFAAIADIHSIKRQIQAYRGHSDVAVAGHNIKLGRGGIREIEFFVQTQQLIAGGRNPDLRGRGTLEMLASLAREEWITPAARDELSEAYRFLRRIENRLQMVADQQTQLLPKEPDALEHFSRFAGFATADELADRLLAHLRAVERHYTGLFEHAQSLGRHEGSLVFTGGEDNPETLETLSRMGFTDGPLISRTVRGWHHGRYAATRPKAARERLTELMPVLLGAFAESEHPDQALLAFDRFLEGLPAGVQLFSMLLANEHLLSLIADIMGTAPRLARLLRERPRTLEVVLDPDFYAPLPDAAAYLEASREAIGGAADFEDCLDRARTFGQEQFFRIGVRQLTTTTDASDAGAASSNLAAGVISALLDGVEEELRARSGQVPGGAAVVLGLGKLGGAEMTATSDLDLILLYDVAEGATESEGDRPLSVGQYYARLTQRLVSALSAPTAEGRLYEVDMRLRPSGRAGPVATRISAFGEYHRETARTWEHMALTRARAVAGDPGLAAIATTAIHEILTRRRDPDALATDVRDMRARIEAEKGTEDIWSLKQVRGGLIDIEFIAQYLQLRHGHEHPGILDTNTGAALARLTEAGLLNVGDGEALQASLALYHAVTQMVRLCLGEPSDPTGAAPSFKRRVARAAGLPDFSATEADLARNQAQTLAIFNRLLG